MNTAVKLDMNENENPKYKNNDLDDAIEEFTYTDTNFDALKYKEPVKANNNMIPRGKYDLTLFGE